MDRKQLSLSLNLVLTLAAATLSTACFEIDEPGSDEVGTTDTDTAETTSADTDTSTGTTSADTDTSTSTDTGDDPYVFDESPPAMYSQFDRMGMPAVNTALISSKNVYNADDPASDNEGIYVDEIIGNLAGLHDALDDDLLGLGLTPCDVDTCVSQGGPLVIPDTLKLNLAALAGFPNGRRLEDPVMDVVLAVIMLDLSVPGQDATSFVGVLNPDANDVGFSNAFPYLAPPN